VFVSPHDYQAIFEVRLSKEGLDEPKAVYVNDRKAHPEVKMYSLLATEPFVLVGLVTPANPQDPQPTPRRSSFPGNIWRGHFEASPPMEHAVPQGERVPQLDNTNAHVTNVILFRRLDPYVQALPQLAYVLFGTVQELFLVHVISQPPDFDQILTNYLKTFVVGYDLRHPAPIGGSDERTPTRREAASDDLARAGRAVGEDRAHPQRARPAQEEDRPRPRADRRGVFDAVI
jgi:hypothetical protein